MHSTVAPSAHQLAGDDDPNVDCSVGCRATGWTNFGNSDTPLVTEEGVSPISGTAVEVGRPGCASGRLTTAAAAGAMTVTTNTATIAASAMLCCTLTLASDRPRVVTTPPLKHHHSDASGQSKVPSRVFQPVQWPSSQPPPPRHCGTAHTPVLQSGWH